MAVPTATGTFSRAGSFLVIYASQYDAYHRVTRIYPPAGASYGSEKRFIYDSYDPDPGQNTYGRLAAVEWNDDRPVGGVYYGRANAFSYNAAGAVTSSRMDAWDQYGSMSSDEISFDWTMQGEPSRVGYPSGRSVYYSLDSVGRPNGLGSWGNWTGYHAWSWKDLATGAGYNKAGQLTTIDFPGSVRETRTYNDLLQLTGIRDAYVPNNAAYGMDLSYVYPAGTNNGRISAEVDNLHNTRADYTYDQLNRLSGTVSSTGGTTNWGLSFGYDVSLLSKLAESDLQRQ